MMKENNWYVAYTYSRSEKKTQNRVQIHGYETFLPLHKVRRQWSDRTTLVEVPLFPSYLFVKTSKEQIPQLTSIDGIASFVSFNNQPAVVRENEIDTIKKALYQDQKISIDSSEFYQGQKVFVTSGPLKNQVGVLVRQHGQYRFIIELLSLEKKIAIEIPVAQLAPCYS